MSANTRQDEYGSHVRTYFASSGLDDFIVEPVTGRIMVSSIL